MFQESDYDRNQRDYYYGNNGQAEIFLDNGYIAEIKAAKNKYPFDLWAWVIMPEHVHLVVFPQEKTLISNILSSIKGCAPYISFFMGLKKKDDCSDALLHAIFYLVAKTHLIPKGMKEIQVGPHISLSKGVWTISSTQTVTKPRKLKPSSKLSTKPLTRTPTKKQIIKKTIKIDDSE